MGTRQIRTECRATSEKHESTEYDWDDYTREFWITTEFLTPEDFVEIAENKTCPVCGSDEWQTTDFSQI